MVVTRCVLLALLFLAPAPGCSSDASKPAKSSPPPLIVAVVDVSADEATEQDSAWEEDEDEATAQSVEVRMTIEPEAEPEAEAGAAPPPTTPSASLPKPPAGPVRQAKGLFRKGMEAYKRGNYQVAYQAFMAAHQLTQMSALLFNAAQAAEKAGNRSEACRLYAKFVRHGPPGGGGAQISAQKFANLCGGQPTP